MKKNKGLLIGIIIFVGIIGLLAWQGSKPGKYDQVAQCIADSGAKFYGAFWCPHCRDQKTMFGRSAKFLPYVECSQPNGKGQLQVCIDKKIEGYPAWEFADGTRVSGKMTIEQLVEKTACSISQE